MSALVNPDGPPGAVARAAKEGRIDIVASWELAEELLAVLGRPKLHRYRITPEDERQVLVLLGRAFPSVELDVRLRDPDDAIVVAAAVFGGAEAIVTGDSGLLEDTQLCSWLSERRIELLTPAELLERLT